MSVTRDEVRQIAALARLRFSDEEADDLARDLSRILDYVDQLQQLDTSDVPPMEHPLDLRNVGRDDLVRERISREDALASAPDAHDQFFRVPRVIE